MILDLDSGNDVAAVSASVTVPVIFVGGAGNDGLFGGGGIDTFEGGSGIDNVVSRDGRAEQVDCGADRDTAISDDGDTRISCEDIEGDADGDGVRRPADCDDTNPGIRPGVPDTPDDRIDQDCSGTDATNLDVDRDGSPRPQDCNDADPAIHPRARERAGNGVDENCDTRIVPFPAISGLVSNLWRGAGSRTVNSGSRPKTSPRTRRSRCSAPAAGARSGRSRGGSGGAGSDGEPASLSRQPRSRPRRGRRGPLRARRAHRPRAPLPHGVPRRAGRRLPLQAAGAQLRDC